MESHRFDALTRNLATDTSRRRMLARLTASAAAGILARLGPASLQAQGKPDKPDKPDKPNKPDTPGNNSNDTSDTPGQGPACREAGHPCEGNQECCPGLECVASGPGAARRCTAPTVEADAEECPTCSTEQVAVTALVPYRIDVACAYDAGVDLTTCDCTAAGDASAPAVTQVVLPPADVCAEVVSGAAEFLAPAPDQRVAGYASTPGEATLSLKLAGEVEAGGTTTYWVTTETGLVPAEGPGLVRIVHDVIGSVEVRAAACEGAAPEDRAGFDWYGRCPQPAEGLAFDLAPVGGRTQGLEGTTDTSGRLRFGSLAPGMYHLTFVDGAWCHAESDKVNASGEVVVEANRTSTVWIFTCAGQ